MSQLSPVDGYTTRSPSPASQIENHDIQLTPRSKIRALLAGLDDSDDDGVQLHPKAGAPLALSASKPHETTKLKSNIEDESGDEEDTIVIPKGRLAARLQAQTDKTSSESDPTHSESHVLYYGSDNDETTRAGSNATTVSNVPGRRHLLKTRRPMSTEEEEGQNQGEDGFRARSMLSDDGIEQSPVPQDVFSHATPNGSAQENHTGTKNDRFKALVEKKRAERMARETAEAVKRAEKEAIRKNTTTAIEESEVDSNDEDSESDLRLTQKTRPVRKAGKKAIEEMARETQRISRNMQLAHEAKTKKKITKESLLARFKPQTKPSLISVPASSSTAHSSIPNSDTEDQRSTPQTSPETQANWKPAHIPALIPETSNLRDVSDDELPSLEELMTVPVDKGKSRALDLPLEESNPHIKLSGLQTAALSERSTKDGPPRKKELKQRPIRVLLSANTMESKELDSSDEELQVIQSKVFRIFDNLPKKQRSDEKSLLRLRALARLTSPSKTSNIQDKQYMTPQELAMDLRTKARRQAAAERSEKIDILRSKGVIIQTSEERQQDQMQVEDMLEKARQEVEELTRKEKDDARREAKANGEEIEDSSGDEEYHDDEDNEDVELSGSEEEDEDSASEKENGLIDDAASESEADEEDADEDLENAETAGMHSLGAQIPAEDDFAAQPIGRRNLRRVIDDDEEEGEEEEEEEEEAEDVNTSQADKLPTLSSTPAMASNVISNPFGPQMGLIDAPMGLTQAFAATMADSQFHEGLHQQDSLAQLRSMPSPDFPNLVPESIQEELQTGTIDELDIDLRITQTQIEYDTLPQIPDPGFTQLSEMPDPTQDAGFQKSSPMPTRFAVVPASTVDTVIIPRGSNPAETNESRRLLNKRKHRVAAFSDEENSEEDQFSEDEIASVADDLDGTAFSIMKQAAEKVKRRKERFDKGKSEAKTMFEEQAQESEDEYAGLGGNSDDSEGEEDEEIREMIDESEVNVNERKIAAYFAEKERQENEAGVNKLFKDINSGALRRKRGAGADFDDLDDSDDEYQARQARKRREFARMRNALFESDSNIVKIAEDPKKMAFLRAIEDRDETDDLGLVSSTPGEDEDNMDSQDVIPDSQSENRPPSELIRRNMQGQALFVKRTIHTEAKRVPLGPPRKPATLADIRASVSFLTEEPDSMFSTKVGPSIFDASSDVEMEDDDSMDIEQNITQELTEPQHTNPRRTGPKAINPKFVDRLSLKRQESSRDSQGSGGNLAFMDPRLSSDVATFKPPALLRKATSSFSTFGDQDENGISLNNNARKPTMEPDVKGRGVGGGSKRSSVNYYARAADRKAALERKLGKHQSSGSDTGSLRRQSSGLSNLLGCTNAWD